MRRFHVLVPVLAMCLAGAALAQAPKTDAATDTFFKSLGDAIKKIQEAFPPYFNRISGDQLLSGALTGLLHEIDPSGNSFVVAKEKLPATDKPTPQIRVRMHQGLPTVASVVVHSEASHHDIRAGDLVLRVDGENVVGKNLLDVQAKLGGAAGTTVKVGTFRMRDNTYRDVTLKREPVESQVYGHKIATTRIGYLQINQVDQKSVGDFEAKVKTIAGEGISGMILDLRNTTGGNVDMAVRMADPFLPGKDRVIAKVQDAGSVKSLSATPKTTFAKFPIVVLQNQGTSGAAEIVAAALQENHRAILMGESTFGTGVYEAPREIGGNLMAQFAVAYVQTPSGKEVMTRGVPADISEPLDPVPAKLFKRFREEFLAFCKGTPPPKEASSTASTGATTGTTSAAASGPTTGTSTEDEEDEDAPKDDPKKETKPADQVLGEYPNVRKYDNTLMRAVNLLISTNIFFEQMLQQN